jgi:alkylation response protein AidB-like acyl-CoA dehydrogenase
MAARVIDRAMQVFGGAGVSQDTFLAEAYAYARFMRMGDGPDQVHLSALGKALIKRHGSEATAANAQAQPRARSDASLFPSNT